MRFGTEAFYRAIGRAFVTVCAVVPLLFAVELVDELLPANLETAGGILPHHISGLDGILFAPFLHDDPPHLYGNCVVLIPLGTFALAGQPGRFLGVTAVIMLIGGLGVWFTGNPNSPVVGASGVIFGYLGYLLVRGLLERSWWNFAVAVLIGLLYGWQLIEVLPINERVSWQGHLFGFFGGLVAAVLFRKRRPRAQEPAEEEAAGSTVDARTAELPG